MSFCNINDMIHYLYFIHIFIEYHLIIFEKIYNNSQKERLRLENSEMQGLEKTLK